ncbi:MAG: permease [Parcubacteria group bacterium Gr01-1014_33]|nr:MAG: permease [Parcubacteria group bacterium Gr01-1014_33]
MAHELEIEEEYAGGEPEAIGIDESNRWIERIFKAFPAFRERNFSLYFWGQFVSLIGTWLQTVAQGWLVLEITHSAYWVGVVSALGSLPILFFALFGGVIVDRFSRKKILYVTQILSLIFALVLGLLALFGHATLFAISVLAFLLGAVNALDVPARHAFIAEMMGKKNLASAIALHSAAFNGSRIIGPAIAGILIALIGTGGTFLVNALSFIAVIVSLALIDVSVRRRASAHPHPIAAIREGLSYAFSRAMIRMFLIGAGVVSIFGWSYLSILPVVTEQVFHKRAAELGYLHTAAGIGAVTSVIVISIFMRRFGPRPFVIGGTFLLGAGLLGLSYAPTLPWGLAAMFVTGFSLILAFSVINSTIQSHIEDTVRGRVMSIYVLMWRGTAPIGSFLMGYMAEHFGAGWAIRAGSLVVLVAACAFFYCRAIIPLRPHPNQ